MNEHIKKLTIQFIYAFEVFSARNKNLNGNNCCRDFDSMRKKGFSKSCHKRNRSEPVLVAS